MANIRKDFLHQLSHRVTAAAEVVQVETLSIKGWQRMWGRKTSDLAPAELLRQLEYKARWHGGRYVKVARDFPSSQLCHDCRQRRGRLGLEIRRHVAPTQGRRLGAAQQPVPQHRHQGNVHPAATGGVS